MTPQLLEILVCPLTRGPLIWDEANQQLISPNAGIAYPVRDGIPIMLPEEAIPIPPEAAVEAVPPPPAQQT